MSLVFLKKFRNYGQPSPVSSLNSFVNKPGFQPPEFVIPTVRCNEDSFLDLSEQFDQEAKAKKRLSLTADKQSQSCSEVDEQTFRLENYSQRLIQIDSPLNAPPDLRQSKYSKIVLKRQTKYVSREEIQAKITSSQKQSLVAGQGQLEEFIQNINTISTPRIQHLKDKISMFKKKVATFAISYLFFLKIQKISGMNFKNLTKLNGKMKNYEQSRLLNDFRYNPEKKLLAFKKDNGGMRQTLVEKQMPSSIEESNSIFLNFLIFLQQKLPIIHPNSAKLLLWDIINFLFTFLNIIYVPIETVIDRSFYAVYGSKWTNFLSWSIVVYLISMVLTMNIGYYDKGYCILNRRKILKKYFLHDFWIDFLSILPMIISASHLNGPFQVLNFLVLLNVLRIDKLILKYFEICSLKKVDSYTVILKLFYILLRVLFLVHCFACVLLALGFHSDVETTWISKYGGNLPENGWFEKYVYALYWGVTVMTTVGFGDLTPANVYEVSFIASFMLVSCGTFAYLFNAIGMILGDLNQKNQKFVEEMRIVTRYLKLKNVDQELQLEVRKYIEYKFDFENDISTEEELKVFAKLSSQIQEKLVISTNMLVIQKCSFLAKNFSQDFLQKLCLSMKSESKLNEEIIYERDSVQLQNLDDIKFYILDSGQVQLFIKTEDIDKSIFIKNIFKGESFGASEFFGDDPRHYSAISVGSTKLLSIDKKRFISVLKLFPQEYEKFCMIRDNAKVNRNLNQLNISCYCCQMKSHCMKQCSYLHYIPDIELTILKNNFSRTQQRRQFERGNRMKINSLIENLIIKDCAREQNGLSKSLHDSDQGIQSEDDQIIEQLPVTPSNNQPNKNFFKTAISRRQSTQEQKGIEVKQINSNNLPQNSPEGEGQMNKFMALLGTTKKMKENSFFYRLKNPGLKEIKEAPACELTPKSKFNFVKKPSSIFNGANSHQLKQKSKSITFEEKKQGVNKQSSQEKCSLTDLKEQWSILNFEKQFSYKEYFQHNNKDLVILQFEIIKKLEPPHLVKRKSQYFLFATKLKISPGVYHNEKELQNSKTETEESINTSRI